jgi:DNA-binding NarL/FixJ family response regulator
MPMAEIQVAVIGSYPALSEAICDDLAEFSDLRAVAADSFLNNIAEFVTEQHPDVLVLDSDLSRTDNGLDIDQLHVSSSLPAIVLLSNRDNPEQIDAAVKHGALAFVLKVPPARELADAIRYAVRGEMWLSPPILTQVLAAERDRVDAASDANEIETDPDTSSTDPLERLSRSERTVLDMLVEGMDRAQIAAQLALSKRDVNRHLLRIRHKLGVKSSKAAISITRESGTAAPTRTPSPFTTPKESH